MGCVSMEPTHCKSSRTVRRRHGVRDLSEDMGAASVPVDYTSSVAQFILGVGALSQKKERVLYACHVVGVHLGVV